MKEALRTALQAQMELNNKFLLVMLFVMLPSFIGSLANIISFAMEHDIFINILPILISLFILGVSYCFSIRGYKKRK